MIDMQAVSKIFRTDLVETQALRSFTLKVDTGEFVAVTGHSEQCLRATLRKFMESAGSLTERDPPNWVGTITRRLSEDATLSISDLAREVRRHPSWLGTAYKRATGEGLLETAARFRIERAARLLRETDQPSARIASEAGFCDQSHEPNLPAPAWAVAVRSQR